jgi:hypothetical protein
MAAFAELTVTGYGGSSSSTVSGAPSSSAPAPETINASTQPGLFDGFIGNPNGDYASGKQIIINRIPNSQDPFATVDSKGKVLPETVLTIIGRNGSTATDGGYLGALVSNNGLHALPVFVDGSQPGGEVAVDSLLGEQDLKGPKGTQRWIAQLVGQVQQTTGAEAAFDKKNFGTDKIFDVNGLTGIVVFPGQKLPAKPPVHTVSSIVRGGQRPDVNVQSVAARPARRS